MHGWAIAFFVVQIVLSIFIYFGGRVARRRESSSLEVFRIDPWVAWLLTIASLVISITVAVALFVENPLSPDDAQPGLLMTELLFLLFTGYGCYCISMRIEVSESSICVRSFLGSKNADFRAIGSIKDKANGRWRTLDVNDKHGKRILYVTSSFLTDYALLVRLLERRISHSG
jgi:hypothetical protein